MTSHTLADLPPPPAGRVGWPWTEASPPVADAMPDGAPWPRITVVTPSFNQGRFLEETIRSVLLQGYPNLEYIVIDGGSTDESVAILRKYAPWLAYWVSEKDRGQTHAINKGLAKATGEVFAYLNSDDVYVAGALETVAASFARHPQADVIFGQCIHMTEDGREIATRLARVDGLVEYLAIWRRFERLESLTQPEVFCRLASLRRVGEFREDLRFVMDFEMWIRMLRAGCRFQAVDAPVAKFRVYGEQKSTTAGEELHGVIHDTYAALVSANPDQASAGFVSELRDARIGWLWRASYAASDSGAPGDALAICLRTVRLNPRVVLRPRFWRIVIEPAIEFVRSRVPAVRNARVAAR